MIDRWAHLRKGLFRAVEPHVELYALTQPVNKFKEIFNPETLPGFVARQSHESKGTIEDDIRLNKDLIQWEHTTPFQFTQFVFNVTATSKSVQAQWTRHKIGVGWIYRSTRYVDAIANSFIYNTYDYLDDEDEVKEILARDEAWAKAAIEEYDWRRKRKVTKEDARKVMPVMFATNCYYESNSRAMRHLFKLRLAKKAEWEIRRMSRMMWDVCMEWTPSHFEDLKELRSANF